MEQIPHRSPHAVLPKPPAVPARQPLFSPWWQDKIWFSLYLVALLYQGSMLWFGAQNLRPFIARLGIVQNDYAIDAIFLTVSVVMIGCSLGLAMLFGAVVRYCLARPGTWHEIIHQKWK